MHFTNCFSANDVRRGPTTEGTTGFETDRSVLVLRAGHGPGPQGSSLVIRVSFLLVLRAVMEWLNS